MKKRNYCFTILTLLLFVFAFSTQAIEGNNGWSAQYQNPKVFIENKGQFHTKNPNEKILYAYDNGSTVISFTAKGVTYSFLKRWKKDETENEEERQREGAENEKSHAEMEAEEHKMQFKSDEVSFIWENANPNVEIVPVEETFDYHSYTIKEKDGSDRNINHINAFKKIIYKNLYPNIDVEYVVDPMEGIKYSLIVHPGADISKVKMKYADKLKLRGNGDLHIPTLFGDIVEHAPFTFYSENKSKIISSLFVKTANTISFKLGEYDHTKTVIIDPWVQTPTLSNSNCVWECEKDGAGNVYIIGGDSPMKLRKYNSTGTMVWTYNTPWDTANYWLGTLATDLAGNSYVTAGSSAKIQKVDVSGAMVWSASGGSMDEYWNISFNCDQTKLITGGTRLNGLPSPTGDGVIFDINTSTGSVNSVKVVGYKRTHTVMGFAVTDVEEVRSMTSSRGAKYYFLTLDSIGAVSQNFSACPTPNALFNINHTYGFSYKCENYRPDNGNSGMKSIKANGKFVYTQNGTTIQKRSLTTGAVLTSVAITGGVSTTSAGMNMAGNSGIDIDTCGNVYVGSGNAVIKYDANLSVITSVALPFRVFDVAVSYGGNVIVAGATGDNSNATRTGYVQSINMSSCEPLILFCCDATVCPAGPFCTADAPFTLTPSTPGGTWTGTGVNASTGVFSPSVAGPGTFTIIYTLSCGSDSISITVACCGAQINPAGPFCIGDAPSNLTAGVAGGTWSGTGITSASAGTFSPAVAGVGSHTVTYTISGCGSDNEIVIVSACVSLTACQETNGNITVTNGNGPFTWTKDSTFTDCSGCFGGSCIPGFCAGVPGTTTSTFATGVTITPPGTYPITVTDAASNTLVINSLASLPNCSNTCPALTVTSSNVVNVSCFGLSTGSFDASTSGGVSPWDYTLLNGGTTVATFSNIAGTQSFTGLPAGTYTLNVLDNNSCPGTTTVTITQPAATTAAAAGPDQSSCSNSATLAGNAPAPGTGLWTLVSGTGTITTPSSSTSGLTGLGVGANVFEWTITNAPCPPTSDQVTITNTGGGAPAAAGPDQSVCSSSAILAGNVPAFGTGLWTLVSGTATITTPSSATSGISGLGVGVSVFEWTITNPPCPSTADQITITNTGGGPTVTISSQTNVSCYGGNNGSTIASATGGTGSLSYLWTPTGGASASANNLMAGTYTISVTDGNGCVGIETVAITQSDSIVATVTTTPTGCGSSDGSATVVASGGTGTLTYLWSNGGTTSQISNLSSQIYTVTITDDLGCTKAGSGTVTSTGGPTASVGADVTIISGSSVLLSSSGGVSYFWTPPTGLNCDTCRTPTASPVITTIYCVTVSDNGGCTDTACVTITVSDTATTIPCGTLFVPVGSVYVPSAFTPNNNDILNDVFKPVANCVHDYNFMIFDRWGEKLFETNDKNVGWSGIYKGSMSKADVYVYKITFWDDPKNEFHQFIGKVTLLR
ncbi:MAG: T9SS type B sorting domain-containing protein [Bacteroidota bacterium]